VIFIAILLMLSGLALVLTAAMVWGSYLARPNPPPSSKRRAAWRR
jgi:hypothetical protein